jgi:hypothetical protein
LLRSNVRAVSINLCRPVWAEKAVDVIAVSLNRTVIQFRRLIATRSTSLTAG